MQTKQIFLCLFMVAYIAAQAQFHFAAAEGLNFRILPGYPFCTHDVNQDNIPDFLAYLYKGTPPFYDSTIQAGYYLSIQDSNKNIRPIISFNESDLLGWEDVNNDGKKDVVFTKPDSVVVYYMNDTVWTKRKAIYFNCQKNRKIRMADIDKNGTWDFYTLNYFQLNMSSPASTFMVIQPQIDSFAPISILSNGVFNKDGVIVPGHFNADNKLDCFVFFPNSAGVVGYKGYLYTQLPNYQFVIKVIRFSPIPTSIRCIDKNKDGLDDLIFEYIDSTGRQLVVGLRTADTFMSGVIVSKIDSPFAPSINPLLYEALDLNCDGNLELFRARNEQIDQQFIYDYVTDSTYKQPIQCVFPGTDIRRDYLFVSLCDYNLDGQPDIILRSQNNVLHWCKNVSYNKHVSASLIRTSFDTIYQERSLIDGKPISRSTSKAADTLIDTTITSGNQAINPTTGKLEPITIKTFTNKIYGYTYSYYNKQVRRIKHKSIQGIMCSKMRQDTILEVSNELVYPSYYDTSGYAVIRYDIARKDTLYNNSASFSGQPKELSILIYPNPATDRFYLKGKPSEQQITLYTASGKTYTLSADFSGAYIIEGIPDGYYWVSVTDAENTKYIPLLITH